MPGSPLQSARSVLSRLLPQEAFLPQLPALRRVTRGRTPVLALGALASVALLAPACASGSPLTALRRDTASVAPGAPGTQSLGAGAAQSRTANGAAGLSGQSAPLVAPAAKQDAREGTASLAAPGAASDAAQNAAGRTAAPAAPAAQSQAGQPQVLPPLPPSDRLVIKNATLVLQVKDLSDSVQRVNAIIAGIPGAYVAASSTTYRSESPDTTGAAASGAPVAPDRSLPPAPPIQPVPPRPAQSASLTLKVPVDAFGDLLQRLRDAGTPLQEQVSTQEVTEEYVDLDAQVRNLEATEQQYQRLMERAQKIEEILPIQQRLNDVRSQIERLRGRMNLLQRRADLSTITLTLTLPPSKVDATIAGEPRFLRTARLAFTRLGASLAGLADAAIYLAIYALPLLPFIAALWWWRRGRPSTTALAGAPAAGAPAAGAM